jgi:hypothetical protein
VTFVAQKYATATMPALAFVAARFAVSAAALAPFALWEFRRERLTLFLPTRRNGSGVERTLFCQDGAT